MGEVGTQITGVPASIHLIGQLNYVTKVVMWSNKQNGRAPRPSEFLPISGYKCGGLKETMLIWTLPGDHYLKEKLNNTDIINLGRYTRWQAEYQAR